MSDQPSSSRSLLKFVALCSTGAALVSLGAQQWMTMVAGILLALLATVIRSLLGAPAPAKAAEDEPASSLPARRQVFVRDQAPEPTELAGLTSAPEFSAEEADKEPDLEDDLSPSERPHELLASDLSTEAVVEGVRELLAKGADPGEEDEDGHNALESAVLRQWEMPVLQILAETGVKISADSDILSCVLNDSPSVEVINFLLAHGASVNDPSEAAESLVEQALVDDDVPDEVVFALLRANPTFVNNDDDDDWLTVAVKSHRSAAVLRAILSVADRSGTTLDKNGALLEAMTDDLIELVAVLLSEDAPIFDYHEAHDTTPMRLAVETDDVEQVRLLALSCAGTDRYRLMGWAECSTDFSDMPAIYDYLGCLEELDQAWLKGYAQGEAKFAEGVTGDALGQSLWKTTDLVEAQRLLLSGASPFWTPRSGELSAFDKACQRRDYHFMAMALEVFSDEEAHARLGSLKDAHAPYVAKARALLALRRKTRKKVLAASNPKEAATS